MHPESRPSGGHEITMVVMKFITFFHDHGPHFHDHVTSFHDRRRQILFIVQIYSSGHEITSAVMNGTLRFILIPFLKTFFLVVMKSCIFGHEIQ